MATSSGSVLFSFINCKAGLKDRLRVSSVSNSVKVPKLVLKLHL